MPFSIPYRDNPLPTVFGPPSARADFCEENYIVSSYVAEWINTLSNVAYLILAVQGLYGRKRVISQASSNIFYGLAFVGIASAGFHGLLKYYAQWVDDFSMQIATSCVLHRAMTYDKGDTFRRRFTILLISALAIETAYHCIRDEQIVHELFFLALILLVGRRTRGLIKDRIKDSSRRRGIRRLCLLGAGAFAFGYFLWQLDQRLCPQLTTIKHQLGMPWGFLFEFHGWWHILTAFGAYIFMVLVDDLTSPEVKLEGGIYSWLEHPLVSSRSKKNE